MKLKKIIGVLFFLISFSVVADSYAPTQVGRYSIVEIGTTYYGPIETLCPAYPALATGQYDYVLDGVSNCKLYRKDTGAFVASHPIAFVMWIKSCPYGGVYQSSINKCVDDTCVAPSVRNATTHICEAGQSVTCPNGSTAPTLAECPANCTLPQYNQNGTCTDPPDCNIASAWGNYFDYGTKTCREGDHVMCINVAGSGSFYCHPLQECKPSGFICTNDPAAASAAAAERANNIAASKAKADAAAAKAAEAATKAATAAAAAQSAKELAAAKVQAAKDALAAVTGNPSSTAAQLSDAVQAYGKALQAQTAAGTKADHSQTSAGETAGYSQEAASHDAAVPGSPTSSHAQYEAGQADIAANNAGNSLNDAIAGGGKGSGEQVQDTGGATEATLEKVLDKLTPKGNLGSYSGAGTGAEKGNFSDSLVDGQAALDDEKAALFSKMTEIKTGVSTLFVSSITDGSGTLPVIEFGNMKGVNVVLDMNKHAAQLHVVSTAVVAVAWLTAFSIILSR